MVAMKTMLGSGIFTINEAALFARVSPAMMSRWIFGNKQGGSVISPQFKTEEKFVSFLDFVQTLAIREIRIQKKIPLPKFRQAIKIAKESFSLDYPFARQHTTYLWGEELVIKPPGGGFVEASGKHRGNRLLSFVEIYLENLSFDPEGLANRYTIYRVDDVAVTMRPQVRFGEPLLPSGYSALAIWEAIQTEGGIDNAASSFGIDRNEVCAAYRFFVDFLGKSAA